MFDDAVATVRHAIKLAEATDAKDLVAELSGRLELYRRKKHFVDSQEDH